MRGINSLTNQAAPYSRTRVVFKPFKKKVVDGSQGIPWPIDINGSARKDSANFNGSAGSSPANIDADYDSAYKQTYFRGFFGHGFSNYDVRPRGDGYHIWGSHNSRNVSMSVSKNQDGRLSGFWGSTGDRHYDLYYGHYGSNDRSLSGRVNEDSGHSDYVNLDIRESDNQLIINGTVGKRPVYLCLDFYESNTTPEEFKKQLEIGAIQMLL